MPKESVNGTLKSGAHLAHSVKGAWRLPSPPPARTSFLSIAPSHTRTHRTYGYAHPPRPGRPGPPRPEQRVRARRRPIGWPAAGGRCPVVRAARAPGAYARRRHRATGPMERCVRGMGGGGGAGKRPRPAVGAAGALSSVNLDPSPPTPLLLLLLTPRPRRLAHAHAHATIAPRPPAPAAPALGPLPSRPPEEVGAAPARPCRGAAGAGPLPLPRPSPAVSRLGVPQAQAQNEQAQAP